MKKVFLALAVVAFVASLASCNKTCTCAAWLNGSQVGNAQEFELQDGSCEDLAQHMPISTEPKNGVFCE